MSRTRRGAWCLMLSLGFVLSAVVVSSPDFSAPHLSHLNLGKGSLKTLWFKQDAVPLVQLGLHVWLGAPTPNEPSDTIEAREVLAELLAPPKASSGDVSKLRVQLQSDQLSLSASGLVEDQRAVLNSVTRPWLDFQPSSQTIQEVTTELRLKRQVLQSLHELQGGGSVTEVGRCFIQALFPGYLSLIDPRSTPDQSSDPNRKKKANPPVSVADLKALVRRVFQPSRCILTIQTPMPPHQFKPLLFETLQKWEVDPSSSLRTGPLTPAALPKESVQPEILALERPEMAYAELQLGYRLGSLDSPDYPRPRSGPCDSWGLHQEPPQSISAGALVRISQRPQRTGLSPGANLSEPFFDHQNRRASAHFSETPAGTAAV